MNEKLICPFCFNPVELRHENDGYYVHFCVCYPPQCRMAADTRARSLKMYFHTHREEAKRKTLEIAKHLNELSREEDII